MVQAVAQEDPVNWKRGRRSTASGTGSAATASSTSRNEAQDALDEALATGAQKAAEHWDKKLAKELFGLLELPGARLAASEAALQQLHSFSMQMAHAQGQAIAQLAAKSAQALSGVEQALNDLSSGGGFRLFGGRSRGRQLRFFVEQLSHFARQRLTEEVRAAVKHFYALLSGSFRRCRGRPRLRRQLLAAPPGRPGAARMTTRTRPRRGPGPTTR
ncbi:MAG: hypothetical protein U0793_00955 [Gemmataceae bacterium]